jgi:hypothetical protein
VTARTPSDAALRVSTRRSLSVTFSKPVHGVDEKTFVLRDSNGDKVPGDVRYAARSRTATLTPDAPLSDTSSYTARLGGSIVDFAANRLVPTRWRFTTVRKPPRASLRGMRLRSRDADLLRFAATLRQDGHAVGRRSGRVRPGAARTLSFEEARAGAARLVVRLTDPQGNEKRLARKVHLGA